MSAKISRLMQVLILSLSLSSSVFASSVYKLNSVIFKCPSDASIKSEMVYSVAGIRTGVDYTNEQIIESLKRTEEKLGIKVFNWKVSPSGEFTADVVKKIKILSIDFEGNKVFSDRKIKDQIGFRAEGSYCEDVCDLIKQKAEKFYFDSGYFDAKVQIVKEVVGKDVNLVVKVSDGKPCTIDGVNIDAEGFESVGKLRNVLSVKKGQPACSACIQGSIKDLRSYLYGKGYYSNSVYKDFVRFSPDMRTAVVNIGVKTGPRYKIIFRGNQFFPSTGTLKKALDISDSVNVTQDYYSVLARKLEDHYKSFGFAEAKVDAVEELGLVPGELNLVFNILEGKQKFIGRIKYDLKKDIDDDGLDSYLRASSPDLFDRGFFVRKGFEDLKATIEKYLNERGYLRAKVLNLSFSPGKKNYENITYQIDPGQPTLVREINVHGNTFVRTSKILNEVGIEKGSPVSIDKLKEGIKWLTEQYRENGYVDFYLDKDKLFSYNEDYRFVDVTIDIKEGERVKVGKIFINGLEKTKDRVITREFRFSEGDVVKGSDMQDTENALAGLGFLGMVSVDVLPTSVNGSDYRDVLVSIEEKKAGSYEIGTGYRTDDGIKVFSGISYGNLGGWGRRIYTSGEISRKIGEDFRFAEYVVTAGYYEPYFLNIPLDLRLVVETRKDDYPDYGQRKIDTALFFEKRLGHHSLILRNAFERINIFDATVSADNASYWKYSIRQTYRFDTRDSIFSPTRGFNFQVYGEWGRSLKTSLLSNYVKVNESMKFYVPLFSKFTLMSGVNAGYVKGLKGESVLLDDRFALGGFDSIRGYREGIIADLIPNLHDQQYYTVSVELRRLLFGNFVASVFHDMGSISSQNSEIQGTFSSVGGGIGIKFPVGSLSLQYGYVYRKDKRIPADKAGRIHLAIGTF